MQNKNVREQWEPHIGKFFLAFTAIEHFVTISIDLLSVNTISKSVRTLLFEKRTEFLLELLECNKKISDNLKQKIKIQLDEALRLSKNVRNIIAHNHILLELYKIKDDENIYQKPYIHSSRNKNKKISLEDMQQTAIQTELLANKLSDSYGEMLGEYWGN